MFFIFNLIGRLIYGKDYEELSRRADENAKTAAVISTAQVNISKIFQLSDNTLVDDVFYLEK